MHQGKIPSNDEVLQIFRRAGLPPVTPLQQKIIPLILRGRDVAASIPAGAGRTAGYVLPLILGLRGAGVATRAIVLLPAQGEVENVARVYARFSRAVREAPSFVPLGEIADMRREERRIAKGATVVAGTVERMIDHIRRESVSLSGLDIAVIELPEAGDRDDFVKDTQFIFAKLAARPQVVLVSGASFQVRKEPGGPGDEAPAGPPSGGNELFVLLRHPVILDAGQEDQEAGGTDHEIFETGMEDKPRALARILLGRGISLALVLHSARTDAKRLVGELSGMHIRAAGSSQAGHRRAFAAFSAREVDVLLAPLSMSAEYGELQPSHVIFYDLPSSGGSRDRGSAETARTTGLIRGRKAIVLASRGQERDLARLQEAIGVTLNRQEIPGDEEVVTGFIDRIVRRIKEGEEMEELARLRSRIRRQVPLFLRPYFMAYLLKSLLPPSFVAAQRPLGTGPAPARREQERPEARARAEGQRPQRHDARQERKYTQLFVSIGRNRRVFARDLTDLFAQKLQLDAGAIGKVRVFDKYSFVEIAAGRAGEAIEKLTGSELKGRTITVNYAKKKEEKEEK